MLDLEEVCRFLKNGEQKKPAAFRQHFQPFPS